MTIAEVSKISVLSTDTLRYYERVGLIQNIKRTSGGIRNYSREDCGWIGFIKCMRHAGLPIDVLIQYVSLYHQGNDTMYARKELLTQQRDLLAIRIKEMQETLGRLNYKIDYYEQVIVNPEKRQTKSEE